MFDWLDKLACAYLDWRTGRLVANDPELSGFSLIKAEQNRNGWEVKAFAPMVVALAEQATDLLEYHGAENYVQFDMMPRLDRGKRPIRVTVQWARGETPAAKATRLENELVLERGVSAERGVTLATLCDMVLGEDAADRSDEALIRALAEMI